MSDLLNTVQTSFKLNKIQKTLFAITDGVFKGEFFVFVEQDDITKELCFLSLPDLHIRKVDQEVFDSGLKLGIVDKVQKIPDDIFEVIEKQYITNKKNTRDI